MIAKRVKRKNSTNSVTSLGRYLLREDAGKHPADWRHTAEYVLDVKDGGGKVLWAHATNCLNEEVGLAVCEIEDTQRRNTRSKADRTYHLVVSFPPGERPERATIEEIERVLVESVGLGEHQRVSAVHDDKEHLHLHVVINKIHPKTYRAIEPYYDERRLMVACEELEVRFGLARTDHGLDASLPTGRGGDREIQAMSLALRQRLEIAGREAIIAAATQCASWAEFQAALEPLDLLARKRGAGLAICRADDPRVGVKASDLDRGLSMSSLRKRWGDFAAVREEVSLTPGVAGGTGLDGTALKPTGGWKLHLALEPRTDDALTAKVAAYLSERGVPFKVGRSSGQEGKGVTVYVGAGAAAKALAADLEGSFDLPLAPDLPEDVRWSPGINARFDAHGNPGFHSYGLRGVPLLAADLQSAWPLSSTFNETNVRRADAVLRQVYGGFYADAAQVYLASEKDTGTNPDRESLSVVDAAEDALDWVPAEEDLGLRPGVASLGGDLARDPSESFEGMQDPSVADDRWSHGEEHDSQAVDFDLPLDVDPGEPPEWLEAPPVGDDRWSSGEEHGGQAIDIDLPQGTDPGEPPEWMEAPLQDADEWGQGFDHDQEINERTRGVPVEDDGDAAVEGVGGSEWTQVSAAAAGLSPDDFGLFRRRRLPHEAELDRGDPGEPPEWMDGGPGEPDDYHFAEPAEPDERDFAPGTNEQDMSEPPAWMDAPPDERDERAAPEGEGLEGSEPSGQGRGRQARRGQEGVFVGPPGSRGGASAGNPAEAALYAEFARIKGAAMDARRVARTALEAAHLKYERELSDFYSERFAQARSKMVEGDVRQRRQKRLGEQWRRDLQDRRERMVRDRKVVNDRHPIPEWEGFLEERARNGDEAARKVLADRARRSLRVADAIITADRAGDAKDVARKGLKRSVRWNGTTVFRVRDGGIVVDDGTAMGIERGTTGAIFVALAMAERRYGAEPLTINGTDEMKRDAADLAAKHGMGVRFADPQIEARRRAALARLQERDGVEGAVAQGDWGVDSATAERQAQARPQAVRPSRVAVPVGEWVVTEPAVVAKSDPAIEEMCRERNAQARWVLRIPYHRPWVPSDAGVTSFRGVRHLADGGHALMLRKGETMLVKRIAAEGVPEAEAWPIGKRTEFDGQGRLARVRDRTKGLGR